MSGLCAVDDLRGAVRGSRLLFGAAIAVSARIGQGLFDLYPVIPIWKKCGMRPLMPCLASPLLLLPHTLSLCSAKRKGSCVEGG